MAQHLNFLQTKSSYSFKYSFGLVFKKIETVLFCLLCVIFLITSRVNEDFSKEVSFAFVSVSLPVVEFAAFPFNSVISLLTDFHELVDAKNQNQDLKEQLTKLRDFHIKALNVYQENRELRSILNFVSSKTSSFKAVRITGRSNQLFNQKLFVDAGKNREIKEGSLVTGDHGAIGRISEVGEDKSRLILLTDPSSRVPIIASKSRTRGILSGNGTASMEILYLPKNHNIEEGDWIFTSGDGDTLPPGLLIGVVQKVDKDSVRVAMSEDVNNVSIVTVMNY